MYKIIFTREAKKQLKKLPQKELLRIIDKVESLSLDPTPTGFKRLKGKLSEYYRVRSGDYRIIYTIESDEIVIVVVKISHRKDVYDC